MNVECRTLGPDDAPLLANVAAGVFDHPVSRQLVTEFLDDPRHHLIVATHLGQVIGFVSAVHYVNPDKPAELWLNEIGVAPSYRNHGVGRLMLDAALKLGRNLGCINAWVLTDRTNTPALRLYQAAGGVEARVPSIQFEFALRFTIDRLDALRA